MHSTKPRFPSLLGLTLCAVLTGCSAGVSDSVGAKKPETSELVEIAGGKGVKLSESSIKLSGITVAVAGSDKLSNSMQPTGEIYPTDSGTVQVISRLPGRITEALVSAGDRVTKGQVIARVDSNDLNQALAAYDAAVSHANLSKNQLDQQRKLAGFGSLSEQPIEDARKAAAAADATVASDEAQIKVDKLSLDSTRKLIDMGEITRKPLEDSQNAYAQAQAAATQAKVTLHSAKANLDRIQILFKGGVFSKQQLEDAETAYNGAVAAADQSATSERLAQEELRRQQKVFDQNLNGAASLQAAQSKLQQDQHTYESDLTAQGLTHKQYERAMAVHKSGIPISQALQQAQDTYDEAIVAVASAANTLKLYGVSPQNKGDLLRNGRVLIPILAPLDGLVAARGMVAGQMTDTSTPLVRLINLDKVYVDAAVYESDVQSVAAGDSVRVQVSAFPGRQFTGIVKWVGNEVSPDTRAVTVRTTIDNPGWVLRPGMFAQVRIGSRKSIVAIAVPSDSVMQEGGKQIVYVQIAPGEFCKRVVVVGSPVGGKVPVRIGLSPGEKVVVAGNVYIEKEQERLAGGKDGA